MSRLCFAVCLPFTVARHLFPNTSMLNTPLKDSPVHGDAIHLSTKIQPRC
eukprot:m.456030 g.456030  ORF g.456030 m.456030 type:complete len:50 (+) comp195974_c0_seq1:32-181(+)